MQKYQTHTEHNTYINTTTKGSEFRIKKNKPYQSDVYKINDYIKQHINRKKMNKRGIGWIKDNEKEGQYHNQCIK